MNLPKRTLMLLAMTVGLGFCTMAHAADNVVDLLAKTPQLSTLNKLVNDAGLTDTLRAAGPITVFAPTDDAIKALPKKTADELASNKDFLKSVLGFHVVTKKLMAADISNSKVPTLQGTDLELSKSGTFVTAGETAVVTQSDIAASNGVVHIIDSVLLPPKK